MRRVIYRRTSFLYDDTVVGVKLKVSSAKVSLEISRMATIRLFARRMLK